LTRDAEKGGLSPSPFSDCNSM